MTISTSDADREGDRVLPEGMDFTNFQKNPVLVWSHDYQRVPIGAVTSVQAVKGGLKASWTWLENDEFANRIKNAWEQGIVRASSIGFIPKQTSPNEFGGKDIEQAEMLELSLCTIPMNPAAVRALKTLNLLDVKADNAKGPDCADDEAPKKDAKDTTDDNPDPETTDAVTPPPVKPKPKKEPTVNLEPEDYPVVSAMGMTLADVLTKMATTLDTIAAGMATFTKAQRDFVSGFGGSGTDTLVVVQAADPQDKEFRLELADDEIVFELADDDPNAIDIDPKDLRELLAAAIPAALQDALSTLTTRAIETAKGRVH